MTSDRRRSWRLDLATAALSSAIGLWPQGQASHQPSTRTCAPSCGNLQLAMRYHRVATAESEALCTACRDSRIFGSPPICVYTDSLRVRLRTGPPSVGWTSHGQPSATAESIQALRHCYGPEIKNNKAPTSAEPRTSTAESEAVSPKGRSVVRRSMTLSW